MNSWDLRSFRNDLSIFIDILKREKVTGDFSELEILLSDIDQKELVEYKIDSVAFHINGRIPGTVPTDLNYCQIFLQHMLMVKSPLSDDKDPLHGYYFDFNIFVYKSKKSRRKSYTSSWHHDRHTDLTNVKYTHPTYHFQFGGKKMEYIDEDMSILSCPRIPHPPMDVFLGFHFIISNYYNNKSFAFVNSLLTNIDYQNIIKRAQERLWKPYFNGFDSKNTHLDFTIKNIFPLYLS